MAVTFLTNEDKMVIDNAINEIAIEMTDADNALNKKIEALEEIVIPPEKPEIIINEYQGGYYNHSDVLTTVSNTSCKYTNLIPVSEGDRFSYAGVGNTYQPSIIWYDEEQNVLTTEDIDNPSGAKLITVPKNVCFVKFLSFNWDSVSGVRFEVYHMNREDEEREIIIESRDGGYWNKDNKFMVSSQGYGAKRTNPIPVIEGDVFYYTGYSNWGNPSVSWFDENGKKISQGAYQEYTVLTPPDGAVLAIFYSLSNQGLDNCKLFVTYENEDNIVERLQGSNYLWKKKYVACGDSFTAGDFSEKTDETWDTVMGEYKTYCWHIANRNNMKLINEALSGSTMHDNGSENAFSVTRYTEIPTDADYITLCFGLNETSATIGTLQDTTNETILGAWNVVLEYLITNIPFAKIGIIIPDAWCTKELRDAIISVAKYWGIPYLDLKGDTNVPMMIGGRYSDTTISSTARSLRNAAFQISSDNAHPNPKAHAYRSTVIENFMRSL